MLNNTANQIQNFENLPIEIKTSARFIPVKPDKKPKIKDWSNPDNQKTFDKIEGVAGFDTTGHGNGVDYLFLDFDHVLDKDGNFVNDNAAKCYENLTDNFNEIYVEISISGTGLHAFLVPTAGKFDKNAAGDKSTIYFDEGDNAPKLEIFYKTEGRYCLVTGNPLLADCYDIPKGEKVDAYFSELLSQIETRRTKEKEIKSAVKEVIQGNDPPEYTKALAIALLDYISPAPLSDSDWTAINTALKNCGVDYATADSWNIKGEHYNEEENLTRWNSLNGVDFGITTLIGKANYPIDFIKDFKKQWYKDNTDNKFGEIDSLKAELKTVEKQLSDFDAEKKTNFECLKNLETFDRDTIFADNVLTAAAFAKLYNRQIFSELKTAIQKFKKAQPEKGVSLQDFTAAVGDFEKSITARKKDLDATRTQIKAKIQTLEFIADNKSLKNLNIPQNFTITEEGVGKIEGDHIRTFCRRPVYIKRNLKNLEDDALKQVLSYEDINHRQHILKPLPLNVIRNKNRLIEVADTGFPVDSLNAQELVDFLHCLQDENENNLETIFTINNCGWYERNDKKYFVDPRRTNEIEVDGVKGKLTVDADKCTMANSLTSKGSIDEWRKAYLLAKPSTIARATVAAAFCAPLLEMLGERNFVVYIHGKTRGGKSTAQSLAASAFGKTSDLIITFDGSIIGLNSAAAERNHYPFFIDEQQSATPAMKQDLQRWLYNDANGNERQRANKDGTARNIRKWRHVTICNGEVTISKDNWTGGAHTRLLQIAAPDVILKPDTAKQIQDIIKNNYGVAFNLFLDTILQTPIEDIKEMVDSKAKDLQGVYKDAIPEHCRYISLLRAADKYLNKALGVDNYGDLRTEELFDALPTADEIDDATREFNAITGFIAEKAAHFEGCSERVTTLDCYGRSANSDDYTFITAKALKLICKESEIDYSKVIKDCIAKGYFVPADKTADTRLNNPPAFVQKKINGKNSNCFRIPNRFIFGDDSEVMQR